MNLRNVCNLNSRIEETLGQQLVLAQNEYNSLQTKREQVAHELQDIDDALYVSRETISNLERQRSAVRVRKREMMGIPSERFQDDILRQIFESCVLIDTKNWCDTARKVSQVSRQWRRVALETSLLWSRITTSMKPSIKYTPELFNVYHQRMKKRAPSIRLTQVHGVQDDYEDETSEINLKECNFDRFDSIDSLHLLLETEAGIPLLEQLGCGYSAGPLKLLTVPVYPRMNPLLIDAISAKFWPILRP